MVDFKNKGIFKLKKTESINNANLSSLLIDGEEIIGTYKAMRDFVVFTNKRFICANVQGFTGKKQDFTSFPYKQINAFSVETSGTFDLDSELEIYVGGSVGKVSFEFSGASDIVKLGKIIASYIL